MQTSIFERNESIGEVAASFTPFGPDLDSRPKPPPSTTHVGGDGDGAFVFGMGILVGFLLAGIVLGVASFRHREVEKMAQLKARIEELELGAR